LELFWVRAAVNRVLRSSLADAVGDPVSHCSVGSSMFSWSMAKAGCCCEATVATPKTDAAAAETKAMRDISAFRAVAAPALEEEDEDGAKAEQHAASVDRRTMIFMAFEFLRKNTERGRVSGRMRN
jgi:hypothetical protein